MKKMVLLVFALIITITACSANHKPVNGDATIASNAASADSNCTVTASKNLEGEIKFYPTYDADYKTANNEIFAFWFDIPNDWRAVDQSEDGSEYSILTGDDSIDIRIYGVFAEESEDEFYASLSNGSGRKVPDFIFRDGWVGKKIAVSDSEVYYVRDDGDSYIILHVHSLGGSEWVLQNSDKLNYVAMSARTTRESYGSGLEDENLITLDDLKLGDMKLQMQYEDLLKVMKDKPDKEVDDEYEGLVAKTLFFSDHTEIYILDHIVYSINVTSSKYMTPRGLKTGDSVKRLKELYGEPANINDEHHWGYTYDGYELFSVVIEDGKVVEIQVDLAM